MNPSLDLLILPLLSPDEPHPTALPGLHVIMPPRRAARGRQDDRLILYLTLRGSAPLGVEYIHELLTGLAQTYYKTSGSVTAAQRLTAEALNEYLLNRNLRNATTGNQALGMFTQIVLRGDRVSLAQSGAGQAFVIARGEAQHLYEVQLAGRGLGISRQAAIRYSQAGLRPNDAIVITHHAAASWSAPILHNVHLQGFESLLQYLLGHMSPEMNAFLIQVQPGVGQLNLAAPVQAARPAPADRTPSAPAPRPRAVAPPEESAQPPPIAASPRLPSAPQPGAPPAADRTPHRAGRPASAAPLREPAARKGGRLGAAFMAFLSWLTILWRAVANVIQRTLRGATSLIGRMLPDESLFTIPAATMFFIALAVPVIVVTAASVMYFQRGRTSQYLFYISQAQEAARQAERVTDPEEQRIAWGATLEILSQAERYKITSDSQSLRSQAQRVLDELDYIERLNFAPAFSKKLPDDIHIEQMVISERDDALYMLNSEDGTVLRAAYSDRGYVPDASFQCGPGAYEAGTVGALIAIAPLTLSSDVKATVLGMDANGTLLYCNPNDTPVAVSMAGDSPYKNLRGLTLDSNDVYVLDPQSNAVWIFRSQLATESPKLFFDDKIPPMQDVISLAVHQDDLFLLHADGHMTKCVFSALGQSPTRCEEPAIYVDQRPGRQNTTFIPGGNFSEILFKPPPDPSLYLLEPNTPAIYHFGMGLTLIRQYQSSASLSDSPATAFTFSRKRPLIFLAFGNQVYYAGLP